MTAQDHETLRTIRARLIARSCELHDRIDRVRADLRRERSPLPQDLPDAATILQNDDVLIAIESAALTELVHIRHALHGLDAGTFGHCEQCGDDIDKARLQVVPYAVRCNTCEGRRGATRSSA